jgi:hypothetical protein
MKIQFDPLRTDGVAVSMTVLHCLQTYVVVVGLQTPLLTDYWADFESENGF